MTDLALNPAYIVRIREQAEAGSPIPNPTVILLCRLLDTRQAMLEGKERQVADLLATVQEQAAMIRALRGER